MVEPEDMKHLMEKLRGEIWELIPGSHPLRCPSASPHAPKFEGGGRGAFASREVKTALFSILVSLAVLAAGVYLPHLLLVLLGIAGAGASGIWLVLCRRLQSHPPAFPVGRGELMKRVEEISQKLVDLGKKLSKKKERRKKFEKELEARRLDVEKELAVAREEWEERKQFQEKTLSQREEAVAARAAEVEAEAAHLRDEWEKQLVERKKEFAVSLRERQKELERRHSELESHFREEFEGRVKSLEQEGVGRRKALEEELEAGRAQLTADRAAWGEDLKSRQQEISKAVKKAEQAEAGKMESLEREYSAKKGELVKGFKDLVKEVGKKEKMLEEWERGVVLMEQKLFEEYGEEEAEK